MRLLHIICAFIIGCVVEFLWELRGLLETTDLNIICLATAEIPIGLLLKVEKFLVSLGKTMEYVKVGINCKFSPFSKCILISL